MIITRIAKEQVQSYLPLPLYTDSVAAGFPSPAEDHTDQPLDLNEHLIAKPSATYFARANGNSMEGAKIFDGDLLVVDRSQAPMQGRIVIASVDGQLTCKILDINNRCLRAANPDYEPIPLPEETDLVIEGVVMHAIHHMCWG
jgi:DNA polymerase V